MATQVQIRGAAETTQEARTLTSRELDVNTTDNRICVHNGSVTGGVPHINYADYQNQEYVYGAASGTDAITVDMAKAPSAYQTGQRFTFKAANTNTGSATININSLGAKTLKKKDVGSGSLVTLDAGDIIQNAIYTVFYDGTDMLIEGIAKSGGLTSVSQGDLNTSIGSVSTNSTTNVFLLLPGGEYGFFPQTKQKTNTGGVGYDVVISSGNVTHRSTTYNTGVCMSTTNGTGNYTVYAQQRYVTASPPIDLGDGEMAGFIFLLLDSKENIVSTYSADVPPWVYNGKTQTRADFVDRKTGVKYRKVLEKLSREQILDGVAPKFVLEEITQEIKNADMCDLPHPFGKIPKDHKVILLDTQSDLVRNMIDYQNGGGSDEVQDVIWDYLKIDSEPLKLKTPKGVTTHAFRKK